MDLFLVLLTLLVGLSIPLIPFSTAFIPRLGLLPLKIGHRRSTRLVQIVLLWTLALAAHLTGPSTWDWITVVLAGWFTVVALALFPERIFVALDRPARSQAGLADQAPVLAIEINGETVAFPLELVVPHQISGIDVCLEYHSDGDRVTASNSNGETIPVEKLWWLGWSEFHPRSGLYLATSS